MTIAQRSRAPKVLFLSGKQIYPAQSGGSLRSFGLANALRHHGLEVFVYSMAGLKKDYLARRRSSIQVWPEGINEYVDRRTSWFLIQCASYALSLPPMWLTAYLRRAAASPREMLLPSLLREKLAWCDVVVADFPFVHPIFAAPSARGRLRVLNTHNVEHRLLGDQGRWHKRRIREMVKDIEVKASEGADILVTCCTDDADFFEANARVRRSIIVPNGIDVRRFHDIELHRARVRRELGIADDVKLFLFTASRWGANRDAFDYLLEFARKHRQLLAEQKIHLLVVGNVTAEQVRLPGFTAAGRVAVVEPYFAAADAALNPIVSGAGTNLKTSEFIASRLPIVTTRFGARGFRLEDGKTAFLFEKEALAPVLSMVRRLFDEDAGRLRQMAEDAYAENETAIDMNACARTLVEALGNSQERLRKAG
jgi:glycosyltransferase involved in cell wall biosynthesis